jgi:DMSO/TMAO reductase YedYZ molybdopterin-dependent catalytic subunit
MLSRFVNTALFAVIVVLSVTGIAMLYGTWFRWVFDVHRIAGWLLIGLIPWKGGLIFRSLKRGPGRGFDRNVILILSVALMVLALVIVALGLIWAWRLGPYQTLFAQTVLAWHWLLGLAVIPLFLVHVWRRWPASSFDDFRSRRAVLRMLALGGVGVLGWRIADAIARAQATPDQPRRSTTGSRGFGLFAGNAFPVTGQSAPEIDAAQWTLTVDGAKARPLALTYADILSMSTMEATVTLDCTNGWYTVQHWRGVPLVDLLESTAADGDIAGVRLVSATGYGHTFPIGEARGILLATHVGGEVLNPSHGYPLRAVVPDRRGWFWVKWLTRIEILDNPLDVIGGIITSPRETLRQF